jgi:hypothetical protein
MQQYFYLWHGSDGQLRISHSREMVSISTALSVGFMLDKMAMK